jgi:hypothetical protein
MSGGHATTAGIVFQYEVGAWFATHILCERSPYILGSATPLTMRLEATSPVDDIVVFASNGAGWYVNVKSEVAVSSLAKSPLSKVVDQFVRQVLSGVDASGPDGPRRPWDYGLDRLVLAVKAGGSSNLMHGLGPVIGRLIDGAGRFSMDVLTTEGERSAFKAFFAQVNFHWQRHAGEVPAETDIWRFLSCVRFLEIDTVGADRSAATMMLEGVVGPAKAETAFDALVAICTNFGERRSGGDMVTFRDELNARKISTLPSKRFGDDISKLKLRTESALHDMSRYSKIEVFGSDDSLIESVEIKRACIDSLVAGVEAGKSFLVIGEPGAGKSGAMYAASRQLIALGYEILCLQVDELEGATSDLLLREAGLAYPIADVLANWRPSQHGVLLIDALDASRGMGSEAGVQALISEVRRKAPHWSVVATIRKFDLRYGTYYQRLFEGRPLSRDFEDAEFVRVSHLNVPLLSTEEIHQVCDKWPALNAVARNASNSVQELLSTPFNLYLLGRSLGADSTGVWTASTQIELLDQFWRKRVGVAFIDAEESSSALEAILGQMLSQRCLFAYTSQVDRGMLNAIQRLMSDGVLYQPVLSRQLKFAHHMLFDFALAKLVFMRDGVRSIPAALEKHAADVLMVAPASALALCMAWRFENERKEFWTVAIEIAENDTMGAFLRTLPAKVAAEQVRNDTDILPLLAAFAIESESSRGAASFLARHVLNVLLAGVVPGVPKFGGSDDPWCRIVRDLAKSAAKSLQWPLNAVIVHWSTEELSSSEASAIGEAARHLLHEQLLDDGGYNDGVVSAAIKGVARTFGTAPKESAALVRQLLLAERVAQRGHTELFWLANEFKNVATQDAALAADILITAYTTPLPSSDEKTTLGGSRILSLTSTRRQDFEGILHSLERSLNWFIETEPEHAARALRRALDSHISFRHSHERSPKFVDVRVLGKPVRVIEDLSCIWWSADSSYRETYARLVEALYEVLKIAPWDRYNRLLEFFFEGDVWACIVAAFLRASIQRDDGGGQLSELLTFPSLLNFTDTSFDAGQLIATQYGGYTLSMQTSIQEAILQLTDERQQKVLVGCLITAGVERDSLLDGLRGLASTQEDLLVNTPHFSITSGWSDGDENWWLRDQGVDLKDVMVQELLELSDTIEKVARGTESEPALHLIERWNIALSLLERVQQHPDLQMSLRNRVMDAIATVAEQVCQLSSDKADFNAYKEVRTVIQACLDPSLAPIREVDEEVERQFASSASWGRPAPRIVGAGALMTYIRQAGRASDSDALLVLTLAEDPAVAVRHAVLSRANQVCVASSELARELANVAFTKERNEGVLKFFLHSFNQYINQDLEWSSKAVLELERRLSPAGDKESRSGDLRTTIVHTVLRLWITWDVNEAEVCLKEWASDPLRYSQKIHALLADLRSLVVFGEPDGADQRSEAIRDKARSLFEQIIQRLLIQFEHLWERATGDNSVREPLTEVTKLLDSCASQLYFGSGAYDQRTPERANSDGRAQKNRKRFLREYLPSLRLLARVSYPSVTHPILEIVEAMIDDDPENLLHLLFDAMQGGGTKGGYHFESLGADLVVKIARRFLADYSSLLANSPQNRASLLDVLNVFADTGWAEAKKLVYELPEALR